MNLDHKYLYIDGVIKMDSLSFGTQKRARQYTYYKCDDESKQISRNSYIQDEFWIDKTSAC